MMLAVMYGMTPRANTDSRSSAPPLNALMSCMTEVVLPSEMHLWIAT